MIGASEGKGRYAQTHETAGLPGREGTVWRLIAWSGGATTVRMNPTVPDGNNQVLDRAARI
jgi:hypothetical protein